jgi:CheY-like chemotaxis protein
MARELEQVVIVADDPDTRDILEVGLAIDLAVQIHAFSSGAAALEHLDRNAPPDLILLDSTVSALDAPALLKRIRQQFALARVPVVFVAASEQSDESARLRALGAAAVLGKPLDPLHLLDDVRAIWAGTPAAVGADIAAKLAELKRDFHERLLVDARRLGQLGVALASSHERELRAALCDIRSIAHNIRGSAGSFGAAAVGDAAGAIENETVALGQEGVALTPAALAPLRELLVRFQSAHAAAGGSTAGSAPE